jgi:citrate lyase subunit beta / citryl-CoA lyase
VTPPSLRGPAVLFCPGDRPDRFLRGAEIGDTLILDMEDGVLPERKSYARSQVVAALRQLDPARTVVRINSLASPWAEEDLEALSATDVSVIMLPKTQSTSDLDHVRGFFVIALCETAMGVLAAPDIARHERCVALSWGGQDLAADLGSRPLLMDGSLHPTGRFAREWISFSAAAAGVAAIDTVRTDLDDDAGLRQEAHLAATGGYIGKLVLHPRQATIVREAFQPSAPELEDARAIVRAANEGRKAGRGVVVHEGRMLDRPIVARANALLKRWS